jgi:hypothetical protein
MSMILGSQTHKSDGVATISGVTATPLTKISSTSSTSTTFTATRVTDGAGAWTLTGVLIGDTAVSSDGYRGIVLSIGTKIVNVSYWANDAGQQGTPANGSTVTIHRLNRVKRLLLTADANNTADIYIGLSGTVDNTYFAMSAGASLGIVPDGRDSWIDVTKIYVLVASGTQYLGYMQGAKTTSGGVAMSIAPGSSPSFVDIEVTGQIYFDGEVDNGNSEASDTIDWNNGNKQKSTLTDNCTYIFTPPASGVTTLQLRLIQGADGSFLVTWPAAVKWVDDIAPTLSTTAGYVDIISFFYDGTYYRGMDVCGWTV